MLRCIAELKSPYEQQYFMLLYAFPSLGHSWVRVSQGKQRKHYVTKDDILQLLSWVDPQKMGMAGNQAKRNRISFTFFLRLTRTTHNDRPPVTQKRRENDKKILSSGLMNKNECYRIFYLNFYWISLVYFTNDVSYVFRWYLYTWFHTEMINFLSSFFLPFRRFCMHLGSTIMSCRERIRCILIWHDSRGIKRNSDWRKTTFFECFLCFAGG